MANANPDNASMVYDYISAEQTEINIKESTKGDKIKKTLLAIKTPKSQIFSTDNKTGHP
jgi:hypothetical protein